MSESVQYMVCDDLSQQAEKHTKGTNGKIWKKDVSQTLRIDLDDEVVPAMDKNPEEMAKEICCVASVK